jgi:hypothetical protein
MVVGEDAVRLVALWTVVVVAPFVAAVVSGTVVVSALVGGVVDVSVTDEVDVFVLWWPEEAGADVGGGEADFELNIEQPVSRTTASSHIRRDTPSVYPTPAWSRTPGPAR